MKILYIANIRFPTEKAHGLQIAKTCEALAKEHALEALWVPRRRSESNDAHTYYQLRTPFPVKRLWTIDTAALGKMGFLFQTCTFALSAIRALKVDTERCIYSRDEVVLWLISLCSRTPMVWESHTGSWNWCARRIAGRVKKIVVISHGLKEFYIQKGISADRICVAPDAVDLTDFTDTESKEAARARLGIPPDAPVALYIGRLDGWKGADTFCKAAALLPKVVFVVIGGEPEQVMRFKDTYPNVRFLGSRPYQELPQNQQAADVLVLPNTAQDPVSVAFTSPLKLFTYMASKVPIVASDLPSLREVLSEDMAYFATPDDPEALAAAIAAACDAPSEARERAEKAYARVQNYTWSARARAILESIA